MIANFMALPVKPGSMGVPLPGIEAAIVHRRPGGSVEVIDEPMVEGELALKAGWPSMMRGYLHEDERYQKCFAGPWYLTGDLAKRDADGYFWFVGRADDVIKSSGHLIGPFEVESALMEHPAVAEAGVIGKPDPVAGEIVKALRRAEIGLPPSEDLRKELLGHARRKLGAAVAPKEIDFRANLPKTRSGRSCGDCSKPASWACLKATCQRWKATSDEYKVRLDHASPASSGGQMVRNQARGEMRRVISGAENPRLSSSL
jgi:acetyl-CoA synthetase